MMIREESMVEIGYFSLIFALMFTAYSGRASVIGAEAQSILGS